MEEDNRDRPDDVKRRRQALSKGDRLLILGESVFLRDSCSVSDRQRNDVLSVKERHD
jgi:hypothetical protein